MRRSKLYPVSCPKGVFFSARVKSRAMFNVANLYYRRYMSAVGQIKRQRTSTYHPRRLPKLLSKSQLRFVNKSMMLTATYTTTIVPWPAEGNPGIFWTVKRWMSLTGASASLLYHEDSHIYLKPATGTLAAVDWDFEPYPPNK